LATILHMAVDYAKKRGFKGQRFIEPKIMEPMAVQYDSDARAVLNFLREHNLLQYFMLNIEANHATLAKRPFTTELAFARIVGKLGSIDLNVGDPNAGWDTDHFSMYAHDLIGPMMEVLKNHGLVGGLNFDAKLRRESTDLNDLFYAFIGSMDATALALLIADRLRQDPKYQELTRGAYDSFKTPEGEAFQSGKLSLEDMERIAIDLKRDPRPESGQRERIEKYTQVVEDEVIANELFQGVD